jgi:carboxymethylenebutenolidase
MIVEEGIEIHTPDGISEGYLYRSDDGRRMPGVLHLPDIGGIRPASRDMARRLARNGYTVLLPNVFYRTGRPPVFVLPPNASNEDRMSRMRELSAPLTPDAMQRDVVAYVDFLAAQASVSPGPMGVVGYCFTGSMALRTAANRPGRMAAAASFHGGRLYTDDPSSPHLVLPQVKAHLYFAHAVEDRSMSEEAVEGLRHALDAWGGRYQSEVYEGAHHGWTVPDSPAYNPAQAERAYEKLVELFAGTLQ